jgi:excisionase family DNA binding protein
MARSSGAGRQPIQRKPPTPVRRHRRPSAPAADPRPTDGLAYTYADVAAVLKCSERKVQQLAADHAIAVFYVGPQTPRISRQALEDFMAKGGAPR